jgi:hypothetical protein
VLKQTSTLVERQAAKFAIGGKVDADAVAASLPRLAQRQVAALAGKKGKSPPAHDQLETPRDRRLKLAKTAAGRQGGSK